MITSGFFNSVNGDRKYAADFFAKYFNSFIGNGVFPNLLDPSNLSSNLQITSNNDMTVTVNPGKAWINGHVFFNDSIHTLSFGVADGVLSRIDRVVLRLDTTDREIRVEVKKGKAASSPIVPALQRDADAWELALADITINKGNTTITAANIKDVRLNSALCGIVHGVVDQVNTETLFLEYEQWMKDKKATMNDWLFSNQAMFTEEFYTWFNNLQAIFSGSVEANLLNEIVKVDKKTLQNRVEISDVKLKLSEKNIINFLNKTGIGFYDLFNSLDNIDDILTTANVDVVANNVKFINTKTLKMNEETFETFNDLELNIYDSERITINAMANSIDNKLKVLVTPNSIAVGDKFHHHGNIYTVSSMVEGM